MYPWLLSPPALLVRLIGWPSQYLHFLELVRPFLIVLSNYLSVKLQVEVHSRPIKENIITFVTELYH